MLGGCAGVWMSAEGQHAQQAQQLMVVAFLRAVRLSILKRVGPGCNMHWWWRTRACMRMLVCVCACAQMHAFIAHTGQVGTSLHLCFCARQP